MAKDLEDELDIYLRLFILLDANDTVLLFDSAEGEGVMVFCFVHKS